MRQGHPEICLFRPEIPQNTGNIGRLAAATQSRLHIVRPTGFSLDDKNLRRSGLDYWPFLDLEIHDSFNPLASRFKPNEIAYLSTKGSRDYRDLPEPTRLLVFGQETKGLPPEITKANEDHLFRIPIYHPGVRSLNLANSVAIVIFDFLRQRGL